MICAFVGGSEFSWTIFRCLYFYVKVNVYMCIFNFKNIMTSIKFGVSGKIGKVSDLRIFGWFRIFLDDFFKFSIFVYLLSVCVVGCSWYT